MNLELNMFDMSDSRKNKGISQGKRRFVITLTGLSLFLVTVGIISSLIDSAFRTSALLTSDSSTSSRSTSVAPVQQPKRPKSGPGGGDYAYKSVKVSRFTKNGMEYYVYEPSDPTPKNAPLLVYISQVPGASGLILTASFHKNFYQPLLRHLAQKGYIVMFPSYGTNTATADKFQQNIALQIKDAFVQLNSGAHVRPLMDRFAIAGHSMGGLMTILVANGAVASGLPPLAAVITHEGVTQARAQYSCENSSAYPPAGVYCSFVLPGNLTGIGSGATFVSIIDNEGAIDPSLTRAAWTSMYVTSPWSNISHIARSHKNFLFLRTDTHGDPDMVSNHNTVQTFGSLFPEDAMDWYGYWKPTVAALNSAFYGKDGQYVFGTGSNVTSMGTWSDGVPVTPMLTIRDFGF